MKQREHVEEAPPPPVEPDYAAVIEDALVGTKSRVMSLEKIHEYVESRPGTDVARIPGWW